MAKFGAQDCHTLSDVNTSTARHYRSDDTSVVILGEDDGNIGDAQEIIDPRLLEYESNHEKLENAKWEN